MAQYLHERRPGGSLNCCGCGQGEKSLATARNRTPVPWSSSYQNTPMPSYPNSCHDPTDFLVKIVTVNEMLSTELQIHNSNLEFSCPGEISWNWPMAIWLLCITKKKKSKFLLAP
jgi:hypothetical protein